MLSRSQARQLARTLLSLLTRLRVILFGHEDLASVVFWATLVGVAGALASVLFREGISLTIRLFTGYWPHAMHGSGLVAVALKLPWWHRAMLPALVPHDRLERANGRLGSVELVGNALLGPALGAFLIAWVWLVRNCW